VINFMWLLCFHVISFLMGPSGSIHCGGGEAQCFTTYENFRGLCCCFIDYANATRFNTAF
jgi:hypothetical protein